MAESKPLIRSLGTSLRFSGRKSQSQQNQPSKKDRPFYNTVFLKKPHSFY